MLFPVLKFESKVQVDDQTRLDGSKSYVSQDEDALDLIEIDPDGSGFIDVTETRYLDYEYSTAGTKLVTIRVDNGTTPVTKTYDLVVVSSEDDMLFSSDEVLAAYEPDILNYVRAGRNSYKDVHRRVQALILDWLDSNRLWKSGTERYVASDLIDIQDFKEWSTFWALQLIFESLSDKVDDKWSEKAKMYKSMAKAASERGTLRLDANANGEITSGERVDNISKGLIRA
jgi:hypothetical protein